jgi:peptidoglycan hydrolase-like protein with peptidoglycan-binding domain
MLHRPSSTTVPTGRLLACCGVAVLLTATACGASVGQAASPTPRAGQSQPAQTTTPVSPSTPATPSTVPTSGAAAATPPVSATGTAAPSGTPQQAAPKLTEKSTLKAGMSGPVVLAAQRRLSDLGYWLGRPDGEFGYQTGQAVMALQKAAGLSRDGVLGPRSRLALERGVRPSHRTTSGSAIEVDKDRQLVLVVVGGSLRYVLNTSTGSGRPYTSDGHTYVASTPEGRFSVQRQIDGMRVSRLGELWRPKYFTGGYALHGSPSVPGFPASHGCVRLSNPAIDMLWSSGLAPVGRTVWVY